MTRTTSKFNGSTFVTLTFECRADRDAAFAGAKGHETAPFTKCVIAFGKTTHTTYTV